MQQLLITGASHTRAVLLTLAIAAASCARSALRDFPSPDALTAQDAIADEPDVVVPDLVDTVPDTPDLVDVADAPDDSPFECTPPVGSANSFECRARFTGPDVYESLAYFRCCAGHCVPATSCIPDTSIGVRCGRDSRGCVLDAGEYCCLAPGSPVEYMCTPRTGTRCWRQ